MLPKHVSGPERRLPPAPSGTRTRAARRHRITLALVLALAGATGGSVSAQVHRCKDAAGKTVYSDLPCPGGQAGAMIERRKTPREIIEERRQAMQAEERQTRQQQAWQETQDMQARRAGGQASVAVTPECQNARKEYEAAAVLQTGTAVSRQNRLQAAAGQARAACSAGAGP